MCNVTEQCMKGNDISGNKIFHEWLVVLYKVARHAAVVTSMCMSESITGSVHQCQCVHCDHCLVPLTLAPQSPGAHQLSFSCSSDNY